MKNNFELQHPIAEVLDYNSNNGCFTGKLRLWDVELFSYSPQQP
jgi:hypothetical protein